VDFCRRVLWGASVGRFLTDQRRAAHLKHGDLIACVSPKAATHYRKVCRYYGGVDLADRVVVVPHPVEPRFRYEAESKRRQVACVGRWQDGVQKRPRRLMEVMGLLVAADAGVEVVIAGEVTPEMQEWHRSLTELRRRRVQLRGRVDRDGLAGILRDTQVFYSPSAFESFGIAAAEALCSGCTVVAGRSVSMASFEWFVGDESGTLAEEDNAAGHLRALERELTYWEQGGRAAREIAGIWGGRLHADRVAARVLEMAKGVTRDY